MPKEELGVKKMSLSRYRAWDKENDRMIYPSNNDVYFNLTDDGISIEDLALEPYDGIFPLLDSVLMQSTGLKDKNGVEIFEGDIVLFTIEDGFDYVYGKPGRINLSLQWGAGVRASSGGNYPLRKCREVRIIGNIYENPELLEVE
ncbi:YopX family protein [Enterococcus avium]|uniref:YopX family protein n=1 Tax=Enterococcus avium TaxID=33945 RepID=UPI003DA3BC0C